MLKWIIILVASITSFPAASDDCYDMAGRDYKIDPDLLRAIAWNESGFRQNAVGQSPDNSIDVGLMQINSQHFRNLSSIGVTEYHLMHDACMNIYTGAYILAQSFHRLGVTWQAVGAYNAGFKKTPEQHLRRENYARRIHATYVALKESKKNNNKGK
ncbi:transglycosylase SLT domain-containing protein [Entomohabitans teleogrylli]|uniref:transglycosylase SLT domain-containing protein n=1 Tax=Entomohabitans teleogrylli TaxID=1384589 RepID=UPI00073D4C02|nr:transglycosylase SLT domain-containing protein [Entomohabitans teleogrylli]